MRYTSRTIRTAPFDLRRAPKRRGRRWMAAALLLLLSGGTAGSLRAQEADDTWTAIPYGPNTVIYVRYGKADPAARAEADSLFARTDTLTRGPAAPATPDSVLLSMLRRILREEIDRYAREHPAASVLRPAPIYLEAPDLRERPAKPVAPAETVRVPLTAADSLFPGAKADPTPEVGTHAPPPSLLGAAPAQLTPGTASVPVREDSASIGVSDSGAALARQILLERGALESNLILFESGKSTLLSVSEGVLRTIGEALRSFPGVHIRVEGHTDSRGAAAANMELSLQRAESVRRFLIERVGFAPEQIEAIGYGEERPLIEGDSPTRLALNRRVEFRLLSPGRTPPQR